MPGSVRQSRALSGANRNALARVMAAEISLAGVEALARKMAAEIGLAGVEALARKMAVEIGLAGMASRKKSSRQRVKARCRCGPQPRRLSD